MTTKASLLTEMKAGRELDALIAEQVMGLSLCNFHVTGYAAGNTFIACEHANAEGYYPVGHISKCYSPEHSLARYSTSIAAAWEVLEKLVNTKQWTQFTLIEHDGQWKVWDYYYGPEEKLDEGFLASAPTAPLAICLAALAATQQKGDAP